MSKVKFRSDRLHGSCLVMRPTHPQNDNAFWAKQTLKNEGATSGKGSEASTLWEGLGLKAHAFSACECGTLHLRSEGFWLSYLRPAAASSVYLRSDRACCQISILIKFVMRYCARGNSRLRVRSLGKSFARDLTNVSVFAIHV